MRSVIAFGVHACSGRGGKLMLRAMPGRESVGEFSSSVPRVAPDTDNMFFVIR